MNKAELQKVIKEYIANNLTATLDKSWDSSWDEHLVLRLELEGETISEYKLY